MQNSGLCNAWNGCCPTDSGFLKKDQSDPQSPNFEQRFTTPILKVQRESFWLGYSWRWNTLSWSIWASDPLDIQETHPSSSPQSDTAQGKTWGAGTKILQLQFLSQPPLCPKSFFTNSCMAAKAVSIVLLYVAFLAGDFETILWICSSLDWYLE